MSLRTAIAFGLLCAGCGATSPANPADTSVAAADSAAGSGTDSAADSATASSTGADSAAAPGPRALSAANVVAGDPSVAPATGGLLVAYETDGDPPPDGSRVYLTRLAASGTAGAPLAVHDGWSARIQGAGTAHRFAWIHDAGAHDELRAAEVGTGGLGAVETLRTLGDGRLTSHAHGKATDWLHAVCDGGAATGARLMVLAGSTAHALSDPTCGTVALVANTQGAWLAYDAPVGATAARAVMVRRLAASGAPEGDALLASPDSAKEVIDPVLAEAGADLLVLWLDAASARLGLSRVSKGAVASMGLLELGPGPADAGALVWHDSTLWIAWHGGAEGDGALRLGAFTVDGKSVGPPTIVTGPGSARGPVALGGSDGVLNVLFAARDGEKQQMMYSPHSPKDGSPLSP